MDPTPRYGRTRSPLGSLKDEKVDHKERIDVANIAPSINGERGYDNKTNLSATDFGEVFADGPRLIDLDENGKERPIGECPHLSSCFLY